MVTDDLVDKRTYDGFGHFFGFQVQRQVLWILAPVGNDGLRSMRMSPPLEPWRCLNHWRMGTTGDHWRTTGGPLGDPWGDPGWSAMLPRLKSSQASPARTSRGELRSEITNSALSSMKGQWHALWLSRRDGNWSKVYQVYQEFTLNSFSGICHLYFASHLAIMFIKSA